MARTKDAIQRHREALRARKKHRGADEQRAPYRGEWLERRVEAASAAERETHRAEAERIRREALCSAADVADVAERVRVACNRLIAEGRPITAANLRLHGAAGQDRPLMELARDLAVRGVINPHGYNVGRNIRRRVEEPIDLALAAAVSVEDFNNAWRRLRRPPRPRPNPPEEACSSCPGPAENGSSSATAGSSSR